MVPKCGSLAMRQVFEQMGTALNYTYREGNYSYFYQYTNMSFHHSPSIVKEVIKDMNYTTNRNVYCKHVHFIDFSRYIGKETPYHINLIRDPVEHYISWYYYRRYGEFYGALGPLEFYYNRTYYNSSIEWQKLKNMTFEECVLSNHEECLDPSYTFRLLPFFCGQDDWCLQPTERTLLQAKKNVIKYFPLVGYVENMLNYFELAEKIWPQFFKGAVKIYLSSREELLNINKNVYRNEREPNKRSIEIMKERFDLEYKFYNWIKQRLHCMYQKYV